MKIAYVVPYVPNLIRTRPYNLITQLTSLGHEVHVFTLGSDQQDLIDAQALAAKCSGVYYQAQPVWRSLWNAATAVLSSMPLQAVYSWQSSMAQRLAERVAKREFDIVHVEHLRGSRYGVFIKDRFLDMPVVWDSVDCISHLFRQATAQSSKFFGKFVTRFELSRTRRAEGKLISSFDHVLVTSATDRSALLALASNGKNSSPISVLPNGVDLEYFHPNADIRRDAATVVFSGKMSYHANVEMVKYLASEIMPLVWRVHPEAHLLIVGKDPSLDIKKLKENPLITVTGTVDDIRPFLWRATASVVPLLYGAGIQNKILEAMATGTPVVAASRTLSALQAQPGKDLFVADQPEEYAQNIISLVKDGVLRREIGSSGLAYVRKQHNWSSIASQLTNIYQCVLDQRNDVLRQNEAVPSFQ